MRLKTLPQIRGTPLQGLQNHASELGDNFAGVAETCPRIGGRFCRGCKNPPQNWGTILQGLHKRASELRETFAGVA